MRLLLKMRPQLFRGHLRALRCGGLAQFCVAFAPALLGLAAFCAWPARPPRHELAATNAGPPRARAVSAEEADARLQSAASLALAGRDGAVVVMDAQTGRVRAAVNLELATQAALPPGSAVKPFTLLAALRSGLVGANARLACRRHFTRPGVEFSCAHPVFRPAFDAEQALAHSCNYYFARLGERLTAPDFNSTLASFGFGPRDANDRPAHSTPNAAQRHLRQSDSRPRGRTTFDQRHSQTTFDQPQTRFDQRHSQPSTSRPSSMRGASSASPPTASPTAAPRLPRAPLRLEAALGEGDALLVTPLQLLAAYAALFNGGRLLDPQHAAPSDFNPRELSRAQVSPEERALLVAALRGAVKYGTAAAAELDDLPLRVFGKTGTATEIGGFRTDGWFVGFASAPNATNGDAATNNNNGAADSARAPSDAAANDVAASDEAANDETAADDNATSADSRSSAEARADQPAPSEVSLAVLVFLKRSQGRQAAAAARAVFAEYARLTTVGTRTPDAARNSFDPSNDAAASAANDFKSPPSPRDASSPTVRVRTSRDSAPVSMPLEEYLFGALAAEASTEDEFAALKAQSIVSRTYALRHAGRHARDGFDFCATTHCQRYLRVTAANSRPDFHAALRRAISETSGETLRDARGRIVNAYFSASCGGMTADVQTLWGTPAHEPYERGVRDDYCSAMPHARWTDRVPARRLLLALREDARSDVGARLDQITVVKRDRTGRAELVAVSGERRRVLRGWDFKIIVGRTLGWSLVKSSRFNVAREGADFVFRGSGFGHGLGLCQHGAHTLARRGASHLQILAHYFPGTTVTRANTADGKTTATSATDPIRHADDRTTSTPSTDAVWHADATTQLDEAARASHAKTVGAGLVPARSARQAAQPMRFQLGVEGDARVVRARALDGQGQALPLQILPQAPPLQILSQALRLRILPAAIARALPPQRLTLASANFRVHYPAGRPDARREVEAALRTLEAARSDLLRRLSAASLPAPALPTVEVFAHATTGDFVAATGQPAWVAAATRGARVELQPLPTLSRRRVLPQTLRHELAHVFVSALSRNRAPRWLAEGLAAHFAGEGRQLSRHAPQQKLSPDELEARLARPAPAAETRALYAAAYREVAALVRAEGESSVWRRAARS